MASELDDSGLREETENAVRAEERASCWLEAAVMLQGFALCEDDCVRRGATVMTAAEAFNYAAQIFNDMAKVESRVLVGQPVVATNAVITRHAEWYCTTCEREHQPGECDK